MATNIPLNLKLRNKKDREVAFAQDIIVAELYKFFPEAIIHGGTGIWRCYQGNRFSEDVDVYIKRDEKKIEEFFKSLENKGFKIIKKRLKENSLYSNPLKFCISMVFIFIILSYFLLVKLSNRKIWLVTRKNHDNINFLHYKSNS